MTRKPLATLFLALMTAACARQTKTDGTPAAVADRKQIVGRVDGEIITEGDLQDVAKGEFAQLGQKYYDTRMEALDRVVDERLVQKKAKTEKLSKDDLLKRDVYGKIGRPSDEELKQLYDGAAAAGKQLPPFDDIKEEIAKYVLQKKTESALDEYHQTLRAAAKFENLVPPFRVEVTAAGPSEGEAGAPITIVEFSDYQCPFCSRVEPTVKQVLDAYKGKVRFVYREYPLDIHDHARKASEAALCAADQGKYWEMHAKLFEHQRALEIEQLKGYAKELALDGGKFDKCLDSGEKAEAVQSSVKAGEEAGVTGTPAFFVNGRPLSGVTPFDRFKQVIDEELARKP